MKEEDDDFMYDDAESVRFIKNFLPESVKQKFNDDDIIYIVDLIYEYYDSKGYMDDEEDEVIDVEIDEDEIVTFIINNALSDGIGKYKAEDVSFVVQGELEYCESIGMFK